MMYRSMRASDDYPRVIRENANYKVLNFKCTDPTRSIDPPKWIDVGSIDQETGTSTSNPRILTEEDEVDEDEVTVEVDVEAEAEIEVEFEVEAEAEVEEDQHAKSSCMWRKWFKCTQA
ncbi:hypothetical protein L2E82_09120 [Cichorium intybus]|uniref:Uncharacterized protein n=1 Tax=Cichorium intybus TaxID=13427 RepID=A0ACB9G8K8_CICIN|nr:hypothetical protein L2E82_09120 [Cichorium intybus]